MTVRVKRCEVANPDTLKLEASEFPAGGRKLVVSIHAPSDRQAVHCHDVVTVSGEAPYLLSALSGKDEQVSCVFRLKPGAAVKVTEV